MGQGRLASRWVDDAIIFVPTDEIIDGGLQAALRGPKKRSDTGIAIRKILQS